MTETTPTQEQKHKLLDELLIMKALQVMTSAGVAPKTRFEAVSYDFPAFRDELRWLGSHLHFGRLVPQRTARLNMDPSMNHFSEGFVYVLDYLAGCGRYNDPNYAWGVSELEGRLKGKGITPTLNPQSNSDLYDLMGTLGSYDQEHAHLHINDYQSKGRITEVEAKALKDIYDAHKERRQSIATGMANNAMFCSTDASVIRICEDAGKIEEGFHVLKELDNYTGSEEGQEEAVIFYNALFALWSAKKMTGRLKGNYKYSYDQIFDKLRRVSSYPTDDVLVTMDDEFSKRDMTTERRDRIRDDNLRGRGDIFEPLADAMKHNSRYFPAFVVAAVSSAEEKDWKAYQKAEPKTGIGRENTANVLRFVRQFYELTYKYGV